MYLQGKCQDISKKRYRLFSNVNENHSHLQNRAHYTTETQESQEKFTEKRKIIENNQVSDTKRVSKEECYMKCPETALQRSLKGAEAAPKCQTEIFGLCAKVQN